MADLPIPLVIHCRNVFNTAVVRVIDGIEFHDVVCVLFHFDNPWHPGIVAANEE